MEILVLFPTKIAVFMGVSPKATFMKVKTMLMKILFASLYYADVIYFDKLKTSGNKQTENI